MPRRYEVTIRRKPGSAVERSSGAIRGKAAEARNRAAVRLCHADEGVIEAIKHALNGFRSELVALLSKGGRSWGIRVKAKEIEQFDPCRGSPLCNKKTDQLVGGEFSGAGEIFARMERKALDVSCDILNGRQKQV